MKFNIQTVEELDAALMNNGIKNRALWKKKTCIEMAVLLHKTPIRYRSYGPFWWPIKKILATEGFDFGDATNKTNICVYTEDNYNLAAGVLLAIEWAVTSFGVNEFDLVMASEAYHYVLEDSDMERRALAMSLANMVNTASEGL